MIKKISYYVLSLFLIAYLSLIYYLSSIPGSEISLQTPDYILHGLAFGGLSFLLTVFFRFSMDLKFSIGYSLVFTLVYALSDECHQFFVPGRVPDWVDIVADMVGAIIVQLGIITFLYFFAYLKSKKQLSHK